MFDFFFNWVTLSFQNVNPLVHPPAPSHLSIQVRRAIWTQPPHHHTHLPCVLHMGDGQESTLTCFATQRHFSPVWPSNN
jgi:hypothetical protein